MDAPRAAAHGPRQTRPASPRVAVIIVHYNTSADLGRCLESLAAYPPSAPHRVVIVDNASRDEGLAAVHARFPDCHWIFNQENVGYARGCNRGMAEVEAEYYLVLNPDIVVQPGALDRLLEFADTHPRAGLVGPQLLNEDGTLQESCRRFYTLRTLLLRRTILGKLFPDSRTVQRHLMRDFDHRSSRPVDWVLGGCVLARRTALDRCGPMDERFFLYFEDVDWCYRMWQAGYEVQYTPDARFVHRHRRASARGRFGRSWWLHLGSLISFYEKWGMFVWLLKKWRDPLLAQLLWVLDLVGLVAAFAGAYALRQASGRWFAEPLFPFGEYVPLLAFAALLASITFLLTGRYRADGRDRARSLGEHLQQVGVVAVLLLAATYLGHLDVVSRAVLLLFIPLLGLATFAGDRLVRRVRRRLVRGRLTLERTLLVGLPARIGAGLAGLREAPGGGLDVVGYVAEPPAGAGLPALGGGEVPWLGCPDEIPEIVRRYRVSQVVFWEESGPRSPARWAVLATLRRQRIRLRWPVEAAWLAEAGDHVETFGSELSAVHHSAGRSPQAGVGRRLGGVAAGLALWILAAPGWLWLRSASRRGRGAGFASVALSDIWGHDPELTLAVDDGGRVLPLGWQWKLAGPLLTGAIALVGPRPQTGGRREAPRTPTEVLEFWKTVPRAPGLTGPWAVVPEGGGPGRSTMFRQLWRDPGGFGHLASGRETTPIPAATERSPQEEGS
ncbi:MAG: glycosyltransferase [bacterium]|nr:glycosyltransferase [bacterium]